MEITEDLLREMASGIRDDVDELLKSYRPKDIYYSSVRWKINIDIKGARLSFAMWIPSGSLKRQDTFNLIKDHIEKQYGVKLENQRLYTYEIIMDFGKKDEFVDPYEIYTLLKINQFL